MHAFDADGQRREALNEALRLSKLEDADYLPGWCGPVDDLTD